MAKLTFSQLKIPWPRRSTAFVVLVAFAVVVSAFEVDVNQAQLDDLQSRCPRMEAELIRDKIPRGKLGADGQDTSMAYKRTENVTSAVECFDSCCGDIDCNVAFMFVNETHLSCFRASCAKDELCLPTDPPKTLKSKKSLFMLLVRPNGDASWADLMAANAPKRTCEVGLGPEFCQENEECVPANEKSRNGYCDCQSGFIRVGAKCEEEAPASTSTTSPATPKKIVVQVISKEVQLPKNEATLTAFAVPEAEYEYEWKLLSFHATSTSPTESDTARMTNAHSQELQLADLQQGTYQFRLTVTNPEDAGYAEALANVTVLPPKRINQPPKVVIKPKTQQINLPTSKAIVDASESTDDAPKDELVFKWELISEPVGYEGFPSSSSSSTLALSDLIAGHYEVKVTVTDKDGAKDEGTAEIDVAQEIDYPPTANAGEDVIIYLPTTEVTLHGNQSTDDHGIVSWEWTRKSDVDSDDGSKASDSTNMRSPHPTISNLEEGTYTFELKVTDVKGQSAKDEVKVYVKPAINLPPEANAGEDIEISLPRTWVVLDGSKSKDDIAITSYAWEQLGDTPNVARVENASLAKTNVTGLTKGTYAFKLTVQDNLANKDSSTVNVVVNQDSNMEPRANAGSDFNVVLPVAEVIVNGSKSWDDLAIVKWQWTRLQKSLAVGRIVKGSDESAVLKIVNVVPGEYSFELQVWDEQGKTSTDSVTFTVKDNPHRKNVIRAVFNEDIGLLKEERVEAIKQSLGLLLNNRGKYRIDVLDIYPQADTNNAVLEFVTLEEDSETIVSGKEITDDLKRKLEADSDLLSLQILDLDTLVCQNECSGHGTCHQGTRTCLCEPFWIENFVRRQLMDGESNCGEHLLI